ncbi:MAG TPA: pyridoxal-phosphate dependent enzyme [Dehalococcoidia bacterium]
MTGEEATGSREQLPLLDRFPRLAERTPVVHLSAGPSPVARLGRLSESLGGPDVWLKNDGLYGTIYGGNKPRKLEFVLADALRRKSKTVLTTGAIGTNHGLATALYGDQVGLHVGLLLTYEEPGPDTGRQLLRMAAAGADIYYTRNHALTAAAAPYFIARYWLRDRRRPYILGPGGSSSMGALGFVNAGLELAAQVAAGELPEPRSIVIPVGTGATVAGLLAGLRLAGLGSEIVGVAVTKAPTAWRVAVARLARNVTKLVASREGDREFARVSLDGLSISSDWLGPGYARPSRQSARALAMAADLESLELDPVYTAKTMSAVIGLAGQGALEGPVLYWHTHNAIPMPEPDPAAARRLPPRLRCVG